MDDPVDSEQHLWLRTKSFLQTDFDSEAYMSEQIRKFAPFAKFQTEVQSHLSCLETQILEIILSTKLADNGSSMLARIRAPLHGKIWMFRNNVNPSVFALQNSLRQRAEASSTIEVAELLLDTFHVISTVVNFQVTELELDFHDHVLQHLVACPSKVQFSMKHHILQGVKVMKDAVSQIMGTVTRILVLKSMEDFCRQLRRVTATYKRTNTSVPVRHTTCVYELLRPLKVLHHCQVFLEGDRAKTGLRSEAMKDLLYRTTGDITHRYYEHVSDVDNETKKGESRLLKFRLDARSVTEKISFQLFLDIQEYGRGLEDLGIDAADSNLYRSMLVGFAPDMHSPI